VFQKKSLPTKFISSSAHLKSGLSKESLFYQLFFSEQQLLKIARNKFDFSTSFSCANQDLRLTVAAEKNLPPIMVAPRGSI
jgi:hypothetical protein